MADLTINLDHEELSTEQAQLCADVLQRNIEKHVEYVRAANKMLRILRVKYGIKPEKRIKGKVVQFPKWPEIPIIPS